MKVLADSLPRALRVAHPPGTHHRRVGNVQLERFVNGELVDDVSDPGICEMMYLGHA